MPCSSCSLGEESFTPRALPSGACVAAAWREGRPPRLRRRYDRHRPQHRGLGRRQSFETDPADANTFVSAQIGDQAGSPAAGSIIIKTWKTADGADVTPTAATSFSKLVNWIAVGT
jgi:hypothetical protein